MHWGIGSGIRRLGLLGGLTLGVAAQPATDPCQAHRQPLEWKWGYTRRGAICEGGLVGQSSDTTSQLEWTLVSIMPWEASWPSPGTRYRLAWPAVEGPVTIEAHGSTRARASYRLDAVVQGAHLDWSTEVMRALATSGIQVVATSVEQVGSVKERVYLPVVVTNLDDDDEPRPTPTRFRIELKTPLLKLANLMVTLTRLGTDGTPAGPSQAVQDIPQPPVTYSWSTIYYPLELTTIPQPGLYRVEMTAMNLATQQSVRFSFVIRKS
jgi:hypothetical protein